MFEYQTTGTFIRFVGFLSVYVAAVLGVSESWWMGGGFGGWAESRLHR